MNKIITYLKNFDWIIFSSMLLLISIGLVEIYSIALGQKTLDLLNFKKQILFVIIGLVLLFIFSYVDTHYLKTYGFYIYFFGIILLLAVLFFGQEIRGTKGWFYVADFGVQPVEFVKIVMVIFLARFYSSIHLNEKPLRFLLVSALAMMMLVGLVLLQPDFGSALILIAVWFFMTLFAGFKKRYFAVIGLLLIVGLVVAWFFLFEPYQKQRILTFANPEFDPLNQGYNISQAIIAVGAGGFFGRGVGFGSQSQLKFLPEAQNDFIFAVISEELGFVGVSFLLVLFTIFFIKSLTYIRKNGEAFSVFFILGATGLIFIEMFINIGMNIGLLPVVGISLPFISYGGSSMISTLIIVGIIQSIVIRSKLNY